MDPKLIMAELLEKEKESAKEEAVPCIFLNQN
jgi:hypothetical protein